MTVVSTGARSRRWHAGVDSTKRKECRRSQGVHWCGSRRVCAQRGAAFSARSAAFSARCAVVCSARLLEMLPKKTLRHFQSIAHWGACRKTPSAAENRHSEPRKLLEVGCEVRDLSRPRGCALHRTDQPHGIAGETRSRGSRLPPAPDRRHHRGPLLMAIAEEPPRI